MKRHVSARLVLLAVLALMWSVPALAVYPGSCANGKVVYNKTNATTGVTTSCSNSSCHKSDLSAKNIQNGAGNPGAISNALDGTGANAEMVALDLRNNLPLTAQDIDDLATWIFYAPACPTATPNLQAAPSPVSFSSTTVNATTATTTVTITNSGAADALAVSASSSDATHFPLSASTCLSSLVAKNGGTCSFKVAFHPTAVGAISGTISVSRTGGAPITIGVSGTGTASATPGQLSLATSLGFGNQIINTTSAASSLT
ncbi:MAG: choice-of-anchor D domain-containing protein, partial [Betaproteobacteria bacterium]